MEFILFLLYLLLIALPLALIIKKDAETCNRDYKTWAIFTFLIPFLGFPFYYLTKEKKA